MPDWLDIFVQQTEPIGAPLQFRLWSGITALAGVLERRVYSTTRRGKLYPNVFTFLVGSPASGKTLSMREARKTVAQIVDFKIGPDNPTKASFLDEMAASSKMNGHSQYMAMTIFCEELGVLIPDYDEAFLNDLSMISDNPPTYNSPRRDKSKTVSLQQPTLNILACATPAFLNGQFPEIAWHQGFCSRIFPIYGDSEEVEVFDNMFERNNDYEHQNLLDMNKQFFTELKGEFAWTEEAQEAFNSWHKSGMPPKPDHSRLEHYNGRRGVHALKLSMISAVSAGHGLYVELSDFNRAKKWLLDAETRMPDVFRAGLASNRSDADLLKELHNIIYAEYSRVELKLRKPVKHQFLVNWLVHQVPSERIERLIKVLEQTGAIRKHNVENSFDVGWIPNPKNGLLS